MKGKGKKGERERKIAKKKLFTDLQLVGKYAFFLAKLLC